MNKSNMPPAYSYRALQRFVIKCLAQKTAPRHTSEVLSDALNISQSTAYKKINGESPLNMDEIFLLTEKYGLPLGEFFGSLPGEVNMRFSPMAENMPSGPVEFLKGLERQADALRDAPSVSLRYASTEIPLFHYLRYPELTAFKCFVWGRIAWKTAERGADVEALRMCDDTAFRDMLHNLLDWYCSVPGREYYLDTIFTNTISQIRYYRNMPPFYGSDFLNKVTNQLLELTNDLELMALHGRKIMPAGLSAHTPLMRAPLALFHNEMAHTNNTILISVGDQNVVYCTFDNPNYLTTEQPDFGAYALDWFSRLERRSTPISESAERQRASFFRLIRQRIHWEMNVLA